MQSDLNRIPIDFNELCGFTYQLSSSPIQQTIIESRQKMDIDDQFISSFPESLTAIMGTKKRHMDVASQW